MVIMCIIIYKKPENTIAKERLEICAENNPDGCGMIYTTKDGELKTYKHLSFKKFYKEYTKALNENPESPFLLHFRVTTHGGTNLFNCHPFSINKDVAMMHNGTITNSVPAKSDKRSDTQKFNDTILKGLPKTFYKYSVLTELIEAYIGRSKVAVMSKDGAVTIYNKNLGNEEDGVWYSNLSWNKNTRSTATVVNKGGTHRQWDTEDWGGNYRGNFTGKGSGTDPYKFCSGYDGSWITNGNRIKRIRGEMCRYDTLNERYRPCHKATPYNFLRSWAKEVAPYKPEEKPTVTSKEPALIQSCFYCGTSKLLDELHLIDELDESTRKTVDQTLACAHCLKDLQDLNLQVDSWRLKVGATPKEKQVAGKAVINKGAI